MRFYIVQFRHTPGTRLVTAGRFRAIGPAQAIQQALRMAIRLGESPGEVIATEARKP